MVAWLNLSIFVFTHLFFFQYLTVAAPLAPFNLPFSQQQVCVSQHSRLSQYWGVCLCSCGLWAVHGPSITAGLENDLSSHSQPVTSYTKHSGIEKLSSVQSYENISMLVALSQQQNQEIPGKYQESWYTSSSFQEEPVSSKSLTGLC